jgi:hypothetical protein
MLAVILTSSFALGEQDGEREISTYTACTQEVFNGSFQVEILKFFYLFLDNNK